jgi:hypothetical protein
MAGEVHHRGILQIAAVLAVPHIADLCHHERRAVLWIIQPAYFSLSHKALAEGARPGILECDRGASRGFGRS